MDWLLGHYRDPGIGVASMAEAAQLSFHDLQELCRTHLDTTPGRMIREVRMSQAWPELLAADPDHETVGDIAAGVGYLTPGAFGAHYSAYFGEAPATTLRRTPYPTPCDPPADPPPIPCSPHECDLDKE